MVSNQNYALQHVIKVINFLLRDCTREKQEFIFSELIAASVLTLRLSSASEKILGSTDVALGKANSS